MNRSLIRIMDPHLREIFFVSVLGFSIKLLAAGASFVMSVVVARTLGTNESGLFFLGLSLISVLAAIGQMGLDNTLIRFVASTNAEGQSGQLHAVVRKATLWAGLLCVFLATMTWLSKNWLTQRLFEQPGFEVVLSIMLLALPLVSLYTLFAQALQGLKQIAKAIVTLNVVVPMLLLVSVTLLPVSQAAEVGWLYVVASAVAFGTGFLFWRGAAPAASGDPDIDDRKLLNSCIPLWGVVVLSQMISWSSQILLGAMATAEDVALFSAAQRTAMLTSFALVAVNTIAAPKFAAMHSQGDMVGVRKVAQFSVRLMLLAAVPALLVMLIFPEWLMSLFGEEFRAASTALMILALGQFVNIATGSVGYLLSMTGHEKALRSNVLIGAILGVTLGIWLIPIYGLLGGAIATASAVASQNLFGVYQVKQLLGFNTLTIWRKV